MNAVPKDGAAAYRLAAQKRSQKSSAPIVAAGFCKRKEDGIMAKATFQPEDGSYRFVAILTWPPQQDNVAKDRLSAVFQEPPPGAPPKPATINFDKTESYYLTGARTFVIVGITDIYVEGSLPALGLQKFISSIIYGTEIEAKVYHAVEATQILGCLPQAP
jgi:hypothetical protein